MKDENDVSTLELEIDRYSEKTLARVIARVEYMEYQIRVITSCLAKHIEEQHTRGKR